MYEKEILKALSIYKNSMEKLKNDPNFNLKDNKFREYTISETIMVYKEVALILNQSYSEHSTDIFNVFELFLGVHSIITAVFVNNYNETELKNLIYQLSEFNIERVSDETEH